MLVTSPVSSVTGPKRPSSSKSSKAQSKSKTSCLRGRLSDYRNHSKNSLRSDSFSCRLACLAYATQESKKIPIIVHPINTSSCGMFLILAVLRIFRRGRSSNVFSKNSCVPLVASGKPITSTSEASKLVTALRAPYFFECVLKNIPHEEVFREILFF